MTYDEFEPLTRDGLAFIATGEFAYENNDRMRYQSAEVQRKKAAAVLAELDTQLSDVKDDAARWVLEFRAFSKFHDSIVVWTTLFTPEVAQQNFPNLGKE